jgi:hypothetical protein
MLCDPHFGHRPSDSAGVERGFSGRFIGERRSVSPVEARGWDLPHVGQNDAFSGSELWQYRQCTVVLTYSRPDYFTNLLWCLLSISESAHS